MNAACIITYNPDIEKLNKNVSAIYKQVDKVYIVDNASENISEIVNLKNEYDNCYIIYNKDNVGIACALNVAAKFAISVGCEWIVTLDQDSICMPNIVQKYSEYIEDDVGMVVCQPYYNETVDTIEQTNINCRIYDMNDIRKSTDFFITSAAFLNLKAWKNVGGFDEAMFIDWVDFDMCVMQLRAGYRLIRLDWYGFYHELGELKEGRFLTRIKQVHMHNEIRHFYMWRNRVYFIRKHKQVLDLGAELRASRFDFMQILYENKKVKKVMYAIKGLVCGFLMPIKNNANYTK